MAGRNLTHAGDDDCRLYHVRLLDQFVKGELPEAPFNPAKASQKKRRRQTPGYGPGVRADGNQPSQREDYPSKRRKERK